MSMITFSKNTLDNPVKRLRKSGWIKKQDTAVFCLQEKHL